MGNKDNNCTTCMECVTQRARTKGSIKAETRRRGKEAGQGGGARRRGKEAGQGGGAYCSVVISVSEGCVALR